MYEDLINEIEEENKGLEVLIEKLNKWNALPKRKRNKETMRKMFSIKELQALVEFRKIEDMEGVN